MNESGIGTYDIRQLSDDPSPQPMEVDPSVVQKIFALAGKLHDFDGIDLEMHRRIANLGQKTFQYQLGAQTHAVNFNYTQDSNANQLLDIFESLARQQTDLADLRRAMRYDRLGVNDVLLQVQKDYDRNLLLEPQKFLASLDELAADEHFINIAREKAHDLAARIRASADANPPNRKIFGTFWLRRGSHFREWCVAWVGAPLQRFLGLPGCGPQNTGKLPRIKYDALFPSAANPVG